MKRVLFLTNYSSPYRVRFFDELSRYLDVTVLYSERAAEQQDREADWFVESRGRFRQVELGGRVFRRNGESLCLEVLRYLREPYDEIILCGYSSPTSMLAVWDLRLRRIPFWMEVDGGVIREEGRAKYRLKKSLVSRASRWLGTGDSVTDYLVHYGADREKIEVYPFSSLEEGDILPQPPTRAEKAALRRELNIPGEKMLLAVGQFIPRKGFDLLLRAAAALPKTVTVCIVGGEPTGEYLALREALGLRNVQFVGFRKKEALADYYRAADLFVLPTREDIWGLVINEAMACGLPVVTTDRCVAGLELIDEGVSGHILPTEDVPALAACLKNALNEDLEAMGRAALEKIRPYTIENMAKAHVEILERGM